MDFAAAIQAMIGIYGELSARGLSEQQQRILQRQLNDIRKIVPPELEKLVAEQVGPSAVGSMQSDESLRSRQLQALADLDNVIASGGLDLTDKATIEEALTDAANQQRRARAGVAADMGARGQMNSGARMVMDMDAASRGANAARKSALEVGGMAERRRLQAMQDMSNAASGLREQDWREKESSARARDIRDERNATAREKANLYNAGLAQQNFNNQMAHATGQLPSTTAVGNALGAAATDARGAAAGIAGAVGAYGNVVKNAAASQGDGDRYTYEADLTGNRGGPADISRGDDEK